jgi:hypothetical protein
MYGCKFAFVPLAPAEALVVDVVVAVAALIPVDAELVVFVTATESFKKCNPLSEPSAPFTALILCA